MWIMVHFRAAHRLRPQFVGHKEAVSKPMPSCPTMLIQCLCRPKQSASGFSVHGEHTWPQVRHCRWQPAGLRVQEIRKYRRRLLRVSTLPRRSHG